MPPSACQASLRSEHVVQVAACPPGFSCYAWHSTRSDAISAPHMQGLGPVAGHFGADPPLVSFLRQHAQPQDVFSVVLQLASGPFPVGGASVPGGTLTIGGVDPAITALNQDLTWCGAAPAGVCTCARCPLSSLARMQRPDARCEEVLRCASRCMLQLPPSIPWPKLAMSGSLKQALGMPESAHPR